MGSDQFVVYGCQVFGFCIICIALEDQYARQVASSVCSHGFASRFNWVILCAGQITLQLLHFSGNHALVGGAIATAKVVVYVSISSFLQNGASLQGGP